MLIAGSKQQAKPMHPKGDTTVGRLILSMCAFAYLQSLTSIHQHMKFAAMLLSNSKLHMAI